MSRAILFDFNGVISNDEPVHCRAFAATLAERESISESDYAARYLGLDDRDCFRQAFEEAGMTSPVGNQLTSLIARKNHDYETEIQNSSYLRREIDLVLSVNSLAGSFEFIIAADAVWPDFTGRTAADLPWSHG